MEGNGQSGEENWMMSACSGGNQVGAKTEEKGLVMELKQKKIYTLA